MVVTMTRIAKDQDREDRIRDYAIVDAHDPGEVSMGWYYYLEDKISFPFQAKCIKHRRTSPLSVGEVVIVTGMAPEEECDHDMFVDIKWDGRVLSVPLSQLEGVDLNDASHEGIGDWHYWIGRGYQF
jgi:hypothetical protein